MTVASMIHRALAPSGSLSRLAVWAVLAATTGPLRAQENASDTGPALSVRPVGTGGQGNEAGSVRIDGFFIDRYEYPNTAGHLPVVNVTWEEAKALCRERGSRLCTEMEWEQAAQGPANLAFGYGDTFEPGRCNTPWKEDGIWHRGSVSPSGGFPDCATGLGVHDMVGNVWEWTDGWYAQNRGWRVVRGGSWFHNVNMARADSRYGRHLTSAYRLDLIGFRCCRSAEALNRAMNYTIPALEAD